MWQDYCNHEYTLAINVYTREEGDGGKLDTQRKADVGREGEKGRTKIEEGREGKKNGKDMRINGCGKEVRRGGIQMIV